MIEYWLFYIPVDTIFLPLLLQDTGALNFTGGVPTSFRDSGQQWDFPNAWPPLQEMLIQALASSHVPEAKKAAFQMAQRWITTNWRAYQAKRVMYEKVSCVIKLEDPRWSYLNVFKLFCMSVWHTLKMLKSSLFKYFVLVIEAGLFEFETKSADFTISES